MKLLEMIVQRALAQLNNMNETNPSLALDLTLGEINAIIAALQELPAKICNPLTAKITEQAQAQLPVNPPLAD